MYGKYFLQDTLRRLVFFNYLCRPPPAGTGQDAMGGRWINNKDSYMNFSKIISSIFGNKALRDMR